LCTNQHSEILKLIPAAMLTNNKTVRSVIWLNWTMIACYWTYKILSTSTDNNIRLAQYDRQLHYTTVMMQRHRSSDIRSLYLVKDVPVKNEHMASQLVNRRPKWHSWRGRRISPTATLSSFSRKNCGGQHLYDCVRLIVYLILKSYKSDGQTCTISVVTARTVSDC
jgi:hypothetical protein